MPKLEFTQEEIDGYFKDRVKHHFYERSVEIADAMALHADGKKPEALLEERRPNEPQEVLDYRLKIFTPKTKPTFTKIFSSLQKIRRSADWSIRFEGEFSRIAEEETLEQYTSVNYPYFTSVTNWVFSMMLRKYLIDPNAVVVVAPMSREVAENEYLKPVAVIFDSEHVIDFVEEDYCVLVNPEGSTYMSAGKQVTGKSYYIITTLQILRYDQVNGKGTISLTDQYDHDLGVLPAFKLRGILIDQVKNNFLYESRIGGVLPELDEAIREYSDLQAAKVLHIYPERWEYTNSECTACKGTGKRLETINEEVIQKECTTCKGEGYVVAGPYSKIMIKPSSMGQAAVPTPPAGYVEKDIEIVKVMSESVDAHIYAALAAINFQFIDKSPVAQSGIAKEVDKDELNNTVHSIAEDIVAGMDLIYRYIAYYRYAALYTQDEINEMVPHISVPEKFDMLSSDHLQEELKSAKEAKFNPILLNAMEREYAAKKFNTDPAVSDMVNLSLRLDPLPNITEDDKMSRLSNKGITLETYIISSNIQEFVSRAIEEDEGFAEKPLKDQKAVMLAYALEIVASQEVEIPDMDDAGLDGNGQPKVNEDNIGKIPLAVQQLSLAASRAAEAGDTATAETIKAKINQLLAKLVDATEPDAV